MDPLDNSEPCTNNADKNYEGNTNKNSKDTTKPSDHGEELHIPISPQPESGPVNRPLVKYLNSALNNDNRQHSPFNSEPNPETQKSTSADSHSQVSNKLNSNHCDPQATTSRISENKSHNSIREFSEPQSCQRHGTACLDRVGNRYSVPSTSGLSKPGDNIDNSAFKENRKRPSSLRLNQQNLDDDGSSSDTGNDDYSLGSEEGCVYTYRGGEHLADLPSSFFSLDMGLPLDKHLPLHPNYPLRAEGGQNVREQPRSRASSPDMDFLEMDFDPGPSNEVDSGEESNPDRELPQEVVEQIVDQEVWQLIERPLYRSASCGGLSSTVSFMELPERLDVPSTSSGITRQDKSIAEARTPNPPVASSEPYGSVFTHINARGEQLLVNRTTSGVVPNVPVSLHISSGDLVSPRDLMNQEDETPEAQFAYPINQSERPTFDPLNFSSTLYHLSMAKRLMVEQSASTIETNDISNCALEAQAQGCFEEGATFSSAVAEVPRTMVWTEREACERQVTQIGTSACGATAVVNVFNALGVPVNAERITSSIGTRQRANNAPLPRYLLSRAVAGCTAADLVNGIQRASDGQATARFFPTHPERVMSLSHWLADWIYLGGIPILTLNLQVSSEGEIPDAWHHQMVFGVSSRGIYLVNPVECVSETALWPRLTSPSVLLVRTRDVLARLTPRTDLTPLMAVPDRRWHTANVLGQVVNVIREWRATGFCENGIRTRHISIPASYQAGITIAVLTGSEAHRRLMHAPPLPTLHDEDKRVDK